MSDVCYVCAYFKKYTTEGLHVAIMKYINWHQCSHGRRSRGGGGGQGGQVPHNLERGMLMQIVSPDFVI